MGKGLWEQIADSNIHAYQKPTDTVQLKRYMLYSLITTNKELYDSEEGKKLIDMLTNGTNVDVIFVEELLNARKNTFQEQVNEDENE